MIKKLLLAIALLLPVSAFAQKFGVVNADEVMQSLPAFTEMKTKLEAASKTYEDEFGKLQAEFEKKYTELQGMDDKTPAAIKDRRVQELQELDQKIQQFRQAAQQDLQRQQQQLMQPIEAQVMQALKTVGDEGGYTFIFEGNVPVYTGTSVENVTVKVKTLLGIK